MSDSTTNLAKQESKRITQRMQQTALVIDELTERLYNGSGEIKPSEYDALVAEYHSALRRYEADEAYLEQLNSKGKPSEEERKRTSKKDYKNNYRY